jgi:hypothetical protein
VVWTEELRLVQSKYGDEWKPGGRRRERGRIVLRTDWVLVHVLAVRERAKWRGNGNVGAWGRIWSDIEWVYRCDSDVLDQIPPKNRR